MERCIAIFAGDRTFLVSAFVHRSVVETSADERFSNLCRGESAFVRLKSVQGAAKRSNRIHYICRIFYVFDLRSKDGEPRFYKAYRFPAF